MADFLTLVAEYNEIKGKGSRPALDDMLTIRPLRLATMPGSTAWVIATVEAMLT